MPPESPLMVGRDSELEIVQRALAIAIDGCVTAVIVEGEAGIGKTRLVEAASHEATRLGFKVCLGAGRELEQNLPLAPLEEAFGLEARSIDPSLAHLARNSSEPPAMGGGPASNQLRFQHRLVDWVSGVAEDSPIFVAIDDAQWLDPASMAGLSRLVRSLPYYSLVLLLAFRPIPRRRELNALLTQLNRIRTATRIHLKPLGESDVARIARAHFEETSPFLMKELERAGGNPLLVTELLRHFDLDDPRTDAAAKLQPLPESLRGSILQRMGYLSDRCLRVLRVAAVLGSEVDIRELAAATDVAPRELLLILEEAVHAEILVQRENALTFRHDLVREAIYQELPAALRKEMHGHVAEALSRAGIAATRIAPHLLRAARPRTELDLKFRASVAKAIAVVAPDMAARLLRTVTAVSDVAWDERGAAAASLAQTLLWAGDWRGAEEVARDELPRATGTVEASLLTSIAFALSYKGKLDESVQGFAQAAARAPDAASRAQLLALEARNLFQLGDLPGVSAVGREALRVADGTHHSSAASLALTFLAAAEFLAGRASSAVQLTEQACDRFPREGAAVDIQLDDPFTWRAAALVELGRYEEAARFFEVALRRANEGGAAFALFLPHRQRALMNFRIGRWDDAIAEAETSLRVLDDVESPWGVVDLALLARIACYRDDITAAERLVSRAEDLVPVSDYRVVNDCVTRLGRALIHESQGDISAAFHVLDDARKTIAERDHILLYQRIGADCTRLAIAAGAIEPAREAAGAVEELAERLGTSSAAGLALRCRGLVERDWNLLVQAVDAQLDSPDAFGLAETREALGYQLMRDARPEQAISHLDSALTFWEEVGARRRIARVRAVMREAGVQRRTRATKKSAGWNSLTDTERRVVDLLAEGLYYREVAERLFISRRTVETHVTHIFQKLGIGSRRQLEAAIARREGWPTSA